MDIEGQKKKLNTQIKLFSWIGVISALFALIPLIWAIFQVIGKNRFYVENELGDFIGGTSGTFASFAGLAFVYVAFLGQRLQILMQQEELELNRKELRNTRKEIKGQRLQLQIQNEFNSEVQKKNTFFKLLDSYILVKSRVFYPNYILYEEKLKLYYRSPNTLEDVYEEYKPQIENCFEDEAFKNIIYYLKDWVNSNWKSVIPTNFFEINSYEYIPKRDDFKWENAAKIEIQFLVRAVINEESVGAYFRILKVIIEYAFESNLEKELRIVEAQMGKHERVLAFYWLYSKIPFEDLQKINSEGFLQSVSEKHLFSKKHKNLLLE